MGWAIWQKALPVGKSSRCRQGLLRGGALFSQPIKARHSRTNWQSMRTAQHEQPAGLAAYSAGRL